MLREIKEDLNRDTYSSCIENSVLMSVLPKLTYRFKANPIEITVAFLIEIDKVNLSLWGNENDLG